MFSDTKPRDDFVRGRDERRALVRVNLARDLVVPQRASDAVHIVLQPVSRFDLLSHLLVLLAEFLRFADLAGHQWEKELMTEKVCTYHSVDLFRCQPSLVIRDRDRFDGSGRLFLQSELKSASYKHKRRLESDLPVPRRSKCRSHRCRRSPQSSVCLAERVGSRTARIFREGCSALSSHVHLRRPIQDSISLERSQTGVGHIPGSGLTSDYRHTCWTSVSSCTGWSCRVVSTQSSHRRQSPILGSMDSLPTRLPVLIECKLWCMTKEQTSNTYLLQGLVRIASQDRCLHSGTVRDRLVRVDAAVELLSVEEVLQHLLHLRNAGRSTD